MCLQDVWFQSRGVSEVLCPGLSKLLVSFMKTQIASLPSPPKKILILHIIQRAELPTLPETFVEGLHIFDLGGHSAEGKGRILWSMKQTTFYKVQRRDDESPVAQGSATIEGSPSNAFNIQRFGVKEKPSEFQVNVVLLFLLQGLLIFHGYAVFLVLPDTTTTQRSSSRMPPEVGTALLASVCGALVKCLALSDPQSLCFLDWEHYNPPAPCGPHPFSDQGQLCVDLFDFKQKIHPGLINFSLRWRWYLPALFPEVSNDIMDTKSLWQKKKR